MTWGQLFSLINICLAVGFAYRAGREEERGDSPLMSLIVAHINVAAAVLAVLR